MKSSGVLVTAVLLAACGQKPRMGGPLVPEAPVTEAQRALGERAVAEVRTNFKGGDCHFEIEGIPRPYAELYSAGGGFDPQSPQWAGQCRELREMLGDWQSFVGLPSAACGSGCLRFSGPATFTKGAAKASVDVMLAGNTAWIWSVTITANADQWRFPAQSVRQRFRDSPMPPAVSPRA